MALWTPTFITTALWLDAADSAMVSVSGSDVLQWSDKSGNSRHATSASGTRPTQLLANKNGLNALDFNGTNQFFSLVSFPITENFSYFIVFERFAAAGHTFSCSTPVNVGFPYAPYWFTDNIRYSGMTGNSGGISSVHSTASSSTGDFLWSYTRNNLNKCQLWQYGVSVGGEVNTAALAGSISFSLIGRRGSTSTTYTRGKIYEIIAASQELVTADRQRIEGYLAHKWGIQASLDAGHPYKLSAPVLVVLSGNVTKVGAGGADLVAIHDWTTRQLTTTAIPNAATGAWTATVLPGQYSITYSAANCQPICHGPYLVSS